MVESWIDNVAYSNSRSENTGYRYRYYLEAFCNFIGVTPQQIVEEYEATKDERALRRKYARYLRNFISHMNRNGYAVNTMRTYTMGIKSFFKYSDLPLSYVPVARNKVTFHNRDITKEEIQRILEVSRPRDKAFFGMMAQSGLRPDTLCNLKIKNVEPEFSKRVIPCKVEVPEEIAKGEFGAYFTFIGEESAKYLKAYLATRSNIEPTDYLFTSYGEDKKANPKSMSKTFVKAIENLKNKGLMNFEQKEEGKPRTVRLYNLRKFFRKYAGQAGVEYVNFWMGHKTNYKAPHIPASDVHYFSREDVEVHRTLYKEKAMLFLRLETATPSETEETIKRLQQEVGELRKENLDLKRRLNSFTLSSDQVAELLRRIEKLEKKAQQKQN